MSYTNNIYIPYIEGFHNKENFLIYKNYYNNIGFNVKTFGEIYDGDINYSKIINDLLLNGTEETFIIIDYLIIPKFSINQGIYLSQNYQCMVKPTNKTYILDDINDMNKVIYCMINDEILSSFNYSNETTYQVWPLNGSWIINSKNYKESIYINDSIKDPVAYDFDFSYKYSLLNDLIFIQSDSYKVNPVSININPTTLFVYNEYINSLTNLFDSPKNVLIYKNEVLQKIDECDIKNNIFNVDKYFTSIRYI
jgi:hypothetical protein